ncbi:MAG: hydantoinase/oxoprolinase family protein, partial [bacterium]|nr:hydantoinase/oxoprolinase family protein [bacterium]
MSDVWVGVDTGGTFTDLLAFNSEGQLFAAKTPSTPDDDTRAFLTGLADLQTSADFEPSDVVGLHYGTTVALNAVLQKRWPSLGLIVTDGYREMIEIARQTVPGDWGAIYTWVKPPRVVPLENV